MKLHKALVPSGAVRTRICRLDVNNRVQAARDGCLQSPPAARLPCLHAAESCVHTCRRVTFYSELRPADTHRFFSCQHVGDYFFSRLLKCSRYVCVLHQQLTTLFDSRQPLGGHLALLVLNINRMFGDCFRPTASQCSPHEQSNLRTTNNKGKSVRV